jgi:hypothetical protein
MILGGLFAVKAKDLFSIYGFRQEVSTLIARLDLAKHYALSYQTDVECLFYEKAGGYDCELRSDEPVLQKHILFFNPVHFKHIKQIRCLEKESRENKTLLFSSTGWVFPSSQLEVYPKDKLSKKLVVSIGF